MSGVFLKYVSVTPEPKRPRGLSEANGRSASPQGPTELLEACKTLGIRPNDLQSRPKGEFVEAGTGRLDEQSWKAHEAARLQKLRMVQREVLRRRSLPSGLSKPRARLTTLPPVLPPAVSLLAHRLENINAKVLLSPTKPGRKVTCERRKTQKELALQTETLNRQREEILRKIRGLEMKRQSSHSLRREKQGDKFVSMKSMGLSQVSDWEATSEQDLEAICSQLASLEETKARAPVSRKETLRGRLDSLKTIREERSRAEHREGRRKTSEMPGPRVAEPAGGEDSPRLKPAPPPAPLLAAKVGHKHDPGEEYISLLHDYTSNDQDRILMKWRKAERSLSEIQARQDMERVHSEKL